MISNDFSRLRGRHALYSPSQPSFFNLTPDEFRDSLVRKQKANLGTEIHDWAFTKIKRKHKVTSNREAIKSIDEFIFRKYYNEQYDTISVDGRRLLKALTYMEPETLETVKEYINDAIGYRMEPEVVVGYSERFFGTADTVIFSDNLLRIHDLKTGSTTPHPEQLLGYDALYCLMNDLDPFKIDHEIRIYWRGDILGDRPSGDDVKPLMDKIVEFDKIQAEFEGV